MDMLRPWCLAINMSWRQRQKEHCFTGASNLIAHSFSSFSSPSGTFSLHSLSWTNDRPRRGRSSRVTGCHSAAVSFMAVEEWCLPGIRFLLIRMHSQVPRHGGVLLLYCPSSLVPAAQALLMTRACLCHSSETRLVKRSLGTSTPVNFVHFMLLKCSAQMLRVAIKHRGITAGSSQVSIRDLARFIMCRNPFHACSGGGFIASLSSFRAMLIKRGKMMQCWRNWVIFLFFPRHT